MASAPFSALLGAMSYALDLTEGERAGHTLRACLIGMALGERAGLGERDRADLYAALLLKDAGCSTNAARISAVLVADDHRVKRSAKRHDLTLARGRLRHALATAAHDRPPRERLRTLRALAASEGFQRELYRIRCERGAEIADLLGASPATSAAIRALDEHWDGQGYPDGLAGEEIPLLARIAGLAQTVEICGIAVAAARRGRWFDPALVDLLEPVAPPEDERELAAAVLAHEPPEHAAPTTPARVGRVAHAFAAVVDAKSPATGGHSHRVAALAAGAAERLGLPADSDLTRAALLHDLGKLALSNRILDRSTPLTDAEWVAVREHPLHSEAILRRAGPLAPLAPIAAAHHERLDGSGYPRGLHAEDLPLAARLIAVADTYDSLASGRPYRPAVPAGSAVARLRDEVGAGRLDADCVEAVAAFVLDPGRDEHAPTVF